MAEAPNETRLLKRAVAGDAEAFGDLYELYLNMIYRYVFYRVGDVHQAEDLTEMVFLKVYESLPRFQIGRIPFRAWVYRIAHNSLVDHYRTRKESDPLSEHGAIVDSDPRPEESLIAQERSERLAAAIGELNADYQQILTLRFISGLSHEEAAEILGRSVGAARVLQHRALKALKGKLQAKRERNHG
jgi:RNA polymerase sigma-70 factor (ECF subfamily)